MSGHVKKILSYLKKKYPEAKTALVHKNPLEMLIATILSAQCTDKRVNIVTAELFKKYHFAEDYASADRAGLEQEIKTTGFYRAKAKNIINCCSAIVKNHGGEVPESIEDLVNLPGVGRKTANVVLGASFGIASGVVVDTHVKRLSQRLGLTKNEDPEKIENDLMNIIPKSEWISFGNLLIWHGREICKSRKPKCPDCGLSVICPSFPKFVNNSKYKE